jgi:hypothetical protein
MTEKINSRLDQIPSLFFNGFTINISLILYQAKPRFLNEISVSHENPRILPGTPPKVVYEKSVAECVGFH